MSTTAMSRIDLESALMDIEGDFLLLSLAIDAVTELVDEARPAFTGKSPAQLMAERQDYIVKIGEDDVTALTHARCRVSDAIKKLSAVFYGRTA